MRAYTSPVLTSSLSFQLPCECLGFPVNCLLEFARQLLIIPVGLALDALLP